MIDKEQVDLLIQNLPYEAICKYFNNKIEISGRISYSRDWDKKFDPFTQQNRLLEAIRIFKNENPNIEIEIIPTFDAIKKIDGSISILHKSEDDQWYGRFGSYRQISNEFEKYATIKGIKIIERPKEKELNNFIFEQNTLKTNYQDTLNKQIHDFSKQSSDFIFGNFSSNKQEEFNERFESTKSKIENHRKLMEDGFSFDDR